MLPAPLASLHAGLSESLTHGGATQLTYPAQLPAGDAPSPFSQAQGSPMATAQDRCSSLCCWGIQHTLPCAPHIPGYLTAHYTFCPAPLSTPKQTCQWPAPILAKAGVSQSYPRLHQNPVMVTFLEFSRFSILALVHFEMTLWPFLYLPPEKQQEIETARTKPSFLLPINILSQ